MLQNISGRLLRHTLIQLLSHFFLTADREREPVGDDDSHARKRKRSTEDHGKAKKKRR